MLDERFKQRMKQLLNEDYDAFVDSVENGSAVRGARENLIKSCCGAFKRLSRYNITPLSYVENGYILDGNEKIGTEPAHHSGMIYMQDPGAMAAVAALEIDPSWQVLDLCSAPGGKSSQVAEQLSEYGFILSNEYVPKRTKIIVSNFERLGVKNAIVTSLDTSLIKDMFHYTFDLVIADAPCSGEGMFRKSDEAIRDWSPENVELCSIRQKEILDNASYTVKPNGYLLYSTCTYSLNENEMVVDSFLKSHEDFYLVDVKNSVKEITKDGISFDGCKAKDISKCRRFYPHISKGEGQFIALMKRKPDSDKTPTILYKDSAIAPTKAELTVINAFLKESLVQIPKGRICMVGKNPVLIPHAFPVPKHSVFMSGVLLGEIRNGLLHPSHQFFSAYGELFKIKENLSQSDKRTEAYLRGEEIDTESSSRGWCAVLYEGVSLGGGKMSCGKIKNHYPKGLRNK